MERPFNHQEKEKKIADLNKANGELSLSTQEKEKIINKNNLIIREKNQEITLMKSSKFWKVRNIYLKLKDTFFDSEEMKKNRNLLFENIPRKLYEIPELLDVDMVVIEE